MKTVVVIPHHLPTLDFLEEWRFEFSNVDTEIIIVNDRPNKLEASDMFKITVYGRKDIKKDLGKDSWIIPEGTSACRSYGLYKAWQRKPDMIVTIDNDTFPEIENYFLKGHAQMLDSKATLGWETSIDGQMTRGFPYLIRNTSPVYMNHGLWSNVPDFDGLDMIKKPNERWGRCTTNKVIPQYNFYPMCGMNLAFRPEVTPLMYFGLMGPKYGFDQYDDLWCGIFSKKILDHLGLAVRSGYPSVEHRKQSNAFVNLKKQAPMLDTHEELWKAVRDIQLSTIESGHSLQEAFVICYEELIDKLPFNDTYFSKMKEATKIWINLFR